MPLDECNGAADDSGENNPLLASRRTSQAGGPDSEAGDSATRSKDLAFNASWVVNWLLLFAKIYVFAVSQSKAVLASLADSAVDLLSQLVISLAEYYVARESPDYPVGRARLEALGVIGCACIMSMASLEVLQVSAGDLVAGFFHGKKPTLELGLPMYLILGIGTAAKLALYLFCIAVKGKSDSVNALAEDHLNDVMSNAAAMATAAVAFEWKGGWWVDPAGAILISAYIIWRWAHLVVEQAGKIVGKAAPHDFIQDVTRLAAGHHQALVVDCIRAYHFGARFNVEVEIVLPGVMTVEESHDIALALQHKIEALEDVERAFVHVDYMSRDEPEHKVERMLLTQRNSAGSGGNGKLFGGGGILAGTANGLGRAGSGGAPGVANGLGRAGSGGAPGDGDSLGRAGSGGPPDAADQV